MSDNGEVDADLAEQIRSENEAANNAQNAAAAGGDNENTDLVVHDQYKVPARFLPHVDAVLDATEAGINMFTDGQDRVDFIVNLREVLTMFLTTEEVMALVAIERAREDELMSNDTASQASVATRAPAPGATRAVVGTRTRRIKTVPLMDISVIHTRGVVAALADKFCKYLMQYGLNHKDYSGEVRHQGFTLESARSTTYTIFNEMISTIPDRLKRLSDDQHKYNSMASMQIIEEDPVVPALIKAICEHGYILALTDTGNIAQHIVRNRAVIGFSQTWTDIRITLANGGIQAHELLAYLCNAATDKTGEDHPMVVPCTTKTSIAKKCLLDIFGITGNYFEGLRKGAQVPLALISRFGNGAMLFIPVSPNKGSKGNSFHLFKHVHMLPAMFEALVHVDEEGIIKELAECCNKNVVSQIWNGGLLKLQRSKDMSPELSIIDQLEYYGKRVDPDAEDNAIELERMQEIADGGDDMDMDEY